MAIYLFLQILKITKYSIKLIEKLSRRHLINSFDVFVIKGFTVYTQRLESNRDQLNTIFSTAGSIVYTANQQASVFRDI